MPPSREKPARSTRLARGNSIERRIAATSSSAPADLLLLLDDLRDELGPVEFTAWGRASRFRLVLRDDRDKLVRLADSLDSPASRQLVRVHATSAHLLR